MKTEEEEEPIQKLEEPDLAGTYTARDFISWKTEALMELISGKISMMSPSPSRKHQRVGGQLHLCLAQYFQLPCEVYFAPLDVYLIHPGEAWKKTKNILQPDLCVVCDPKKLYDHGIVGAPDLVVEILSPGTAKKDLGPKKDLYELYGVKELWIVYPKTNTLSINVLENGKYKEMALLAKNKSVQSPTFPGLKVDLANVFRD